MLGTPAVVVGGLQGESSWAAVSVMCLVPVVHDPVRDVGRCLAYGAIVSDPESESATESDVGVGECSDGHL